MKLDEIRLASGALPLVVVSFIEPSLSYLGDTFRHDGQFDFREFVHQLNIGISNIVHKISNCYYLDSNLSIEWVGRGGGQSDTLASSTHASFLGDWDYAADSHRIVSPIKPSEFFGSNDKAFLYGQHLLNRIINILSISSNSQIIKLIIVDLDDTLWRGIAAESDFDVNMRREGWPLGLVEAMLIFKRRGGVLAICSKNDRENTLQRFQNIWGNIITINDFDVIKIGWQHKSVSVEEILQETNILQENAVFIDDNPREVDEVINRFPKINTLGFNHYSWRRAIISDPRFGINSITLESTKRTELIKRKVFRDKEIGSGDPLSYLRSLDIKQRFDIVLNCEYQHLARVLELLNKTNQFNTTGRRWSENELSDLFLRGGFVLATWLEDKIIDNGLIGVVIVENNTIMQVVLSCRVFGLGAEINLIRRVSELILSKYDTVVGVIIETEKNFSCRDLFTKCGFVHTENGLFSITKIPDPVAHIECIN